MRSAAIVALLGGSVVGLVGRCTTAINWRGRSDKDPSRAITGRPVTMPADRVCVYARQIYSIGSVLNGQRCQQDTVDVFGTTPSLPQQGGGNNPPPARSRHLIG